ncbi:MAG: NUDIX hydrolase [Cyanobacteria bacterium REEB459]|nr:NUDIX hydrolase [Cyanobacteria bacterium REEB459]
MAVASFRNPVPTVDVIIELIHRPHRPIVLIERAHPPLGWALPGGFVDYGESVETAARREALEETQLVVTLVEQLGVYSDPARDPRQHTLSVVFLATANRDPVAADDAKTIAIVHAWDMPQPLCFDHDRMLQDYWQYRFYGRRPGCQPGA